MKHVELQQRLWSVLPSYIQYIYTANISELDRCTPDHLALFSNLLGDARLVNIGMKNCFSCENDALGLSGLRELLDQIFAQETMRLKLCRSFTTRVWFSNTLLIWSFTIQAINVGSGLSHTRNLLRHFWISYELSTGKPFIFSLMVQIISQITTNTSCLNQTDNLR